MATWFLVIIYLSFISLGIPDPLLGAAWPVIHPEIGASLESAGMLSMIVAGGTIVSSLSSGSLIRRLGTGKLTLFSCVLTAGSLLGFSVAPSLGWLVVLAIPLGIGGGAVDAALNHYVASNYKAHHMSWLHCFWGVGATMGPIMMSYYIAVHHSWRDGYAAVAMIQFSLVFLLLVTLPLWKRVARLHQSGHSSDSADPAAGLTSSGTEHALAAGSQHPLKIKGVKISLLAFLLYCGVETMVGLWGASFLVGARNITAETAAGWISLYYGGITAGRFITGFITLKVNNRMLILAGQLTAVAGSILLLLPLPNQITLIGFILIGLGLAPIYPGLLHETPTRFGKENSAKLMGYQMAVAYSGSTLLPLLFGLLATYTDINLFPAVVLIFVLLMLFSSEKVIRILKQNSIRKPL